MLNVAAKNNTALSDFCNDCLLFLSDVPPCFATVLMKNGIQRHHVEVQGRNFASETVVSGTVLYPYTPGEQICPQAALCELTANLPICYRPPYVQRNRLRLIRFFATQLSRLF